MRNNIFDKKKSYISNLFSIDDTNLNSIRESVISDQSKYFIQLSSLEGQLLQLLIRMNNVKRVVEIGTLVGYSALCMANSLPDDGHIYTIEKNKINAEKAIINFTKCNFQNRITLLNDSALSALRDLERIAPFDMVFIDADKSNYCHYLDWAEKNIKVNGMIVADNTLLFNTVYEDPSNLKGISIASWNAMRNFNLRLANKSKYLSTLIPTEDGMTVALKIS